MTSKIKVDNIENQCGGAVVTKCGGTTTISGSVVKANNIQASDGGNLVSQSGTTITLGASGDTINLASGASQTGFGRTGTVDWQTGSIKTSTFTATSGEGYFVNTTGGAVTVNLPAGVAGAIVGLKDYAGTWGSNAVTLNPNGSDKIGGDNATDPTLEVNGGAVLLVFVDSTQGWLTTQESVTESPSGVENFIVATGGTVTCSGDYKIHTFTGPGTFQVTQLATTPASNSIDYLVVAGGGGGAAATGVGTGGGAGGFRLANSTCMPAPLTSPLANPTGITATVTSIPVTVGGGGAVCAQGANSVFSTITSAGGGRGSASGGSGGGDACGNTPPVSPPQGKDGGVGTHSGGGGAGVAGGNFIPPNSGGTGGDGSFVVQTGFGGCNGTPGPVGSTRYFAGGGAGGYSVGRPSGIPGGAGGGGTGGEGAVPATAGTTNTGGGGGGASSGSGKGGGSGIVIIRYKFQ
jgi:hypothetical protein